MEHIHTRARARTHTHTYVCPLITSSSEYLRDHETALASTQERHEGTVHVNIHECTC